MTVDPLLAAAAGLRAAGDRTEAARWSLPASSPGWRGPASRAAAARLDRIGRDLAAIAGDAWTAAGALSRLAGAVEEARAAEAAALAVLAAARGDLMPGAGAALHAAAERRDAHRERLEAVRSEAARSLPVLDGRIARLLDGLVPDPGPGTAGTARLAPVPPPVSPAIPGLRDALVRSRFDPGSMPGPLHDPGRTILELDPVGDGRIVEVFGDLPAARHVAVLVPGTGATLANHDAEPHGLAARARTLHVEAGGDGAGVAVVAWLGYDAPEIGPSALGDRRAVAGAEALRRFLTDLSSGARHVTVIGHSYGSVVVSLAAHAGLAAQDLVLVGSPGVPFDHASALRPGGTGRVWTAADPDDPVARIGFRGVIESLAGRVPERDADGDPLRLSHGTNPAAEAFGATELDTAGVDGHSGYLLPGTATMAAIARIVRGDRPRSREPAPPG